MRPTAAVVFAGLCFVAANVALVRQSAEERRTAARRLADSILRITIVGDSVAHGAGDESGRGIAVNLDSLLSARRVVAAKVSNLAVNGSRTYNVIARLHERPTRAAIRMSDVVIVSVGGNDLYGDGIARLRSVIWPSYAMQRTLGRVAGVVSRIHADNPAARILLLGLYDPYRLPSLDRAVAQWDARLIERFAADREVDVIRIADILSDRERLSTMDHFHPGAVGYALIAARIEPAL